MTQPSRTTETINRDNAAIRDIMLKARELTVPDRATLALGLVGHLATLMNRSQMSKLMDQLRDEVVSVQDVPPIRQRENAVAADDEALAADEGRAPAGRGEADGRDSRAGARGPAAQRGNAADERADSRTSAAFSPARDVHPGDAASMNPSGDVLREQVRRRAQPSESRGASERGGRGNAGHEGVGQAGRGEFRSRKLL